MKRIIYTFLAAMLCMGAWADNVAKIGTTGYATLAEAFAAVTDATPTTIEVLADCSGDGITVPSGRDITVNFNNHKYTVNTDNLAGSTGTKTQCFQLLRDSKVTFNNGKIVANNAAIKMIIQNYSDLTLTGMTVDATQGTNSVGYVVSNNNGNTLFGAGTTITAKDGGVAFDVYSFKTTTDTYTGAKVTVDGATINGKIEVGASNDAEVTNLGLVLTSGTINGEISLGNRAEEAVVTKSEDFNVPAPADHKWDADGKLVPKVYVAKIGDNKYESLAEAIIAASADDIIYLIDDIDIPVTVIVNKKLTINLDGHRIFNSDDIWMKNGANDWSLISVRDGGNLTMTGNGSLDAKANDCYALDVQAEGAVLTVESGNYVGNIHAIYVYEGTAYINGGSYSIIQKSTQYPGDPNAFLLNCYDANFKAGKAKIIVSGGEFEDFDPQNNKAESGSGDTNFLPENLAAEKDSEGKYHIVPAIVRIEDKGYKTIELALENAKTSETITLLGDVEISSINDWKDGVSLDNNEHKFYVTNFTVVDGVTVNVPIDFIAKTATYARSVAGNEWGTVCVPFTLKSCDAYKLYQVANISGDKLNITEVETAAPGTPVIFQNVNKVASLTFTTSGADVKAAEPANATLVGTYTKQTITTGLSNIYYINGDSFHQAKVSLTVPAYRAYINYSSTSAKPAVLQLVLGDATGVEAITADMNDAMVIYDANGRRLSAPQKGLNIMKLANGKTVKLIIK